MPMGEAIFAFSAKIDLKSTKTGFVRHKRDLLLVAHSFVGTYRRYAIA